MPRSPTSDDDDESLGPEPPTTASRNPDARYFPPLTGPTSRSGPRTGSLPVAHDAVAQERAFSVILERIYPRLVREAAVIIGASSVDPAEDMAQQALIQLWERVESGSPNLPALYDLPRVEAYLLATVRNLSLNQRRDEKRLATRAESFFAELAGTVRRWMDPMEGVLADEVERFMHRTLRQMPEKRREAWMQVAWFGRNTADVARELDVAESTVRSHVSLAWKAIGKAATKARFPRIIQRLTRRP